MNRLFYSHSKMPFLALACLAAALLSIAPAHGKVTEPTEVFAIAVDGTVLHWVVFTPQGNGPGLPRS